mmetsp:Transcript_27800/g.50217  ORF Transcript_27800/g.50217 Transcript_27800/m.50217 type:complete len:227 (-) Transcript_27800:1089-1769(-)
MVRGRGIRVAPSTFLAILAALMIVTTTTTLIITMVPLAFPTLALTNNASLQFDAMVELTKALVDAMAVEATGESLKSTARTTSIPSTDDPSTPSPPWNSTSRRGIDGTSPSPSRASTIMSTTTIPNSPNRLMERISSRITCCTLPTVFPTPSTLWWMNYPWGGRPPGGGGTRPLRPNWVDRARWLADHDRTGPPSVLVHCGTSRTNSDRCHSHAGVPSSRSIPIRI